MTDQPVLTFLLGDVVRLRRAHPCGGDTWLVDRLGADIGLRCRTCGRHVLVERRTSRAPARRVRDARRPRPDRRAIAPRTSGPAGVTARGRRRPEPTATSGPARRLPQQRVPAALAVAGGDPDRRQHGPLRADRHRLSSTGSNTAVSLLILTFLVPAVLFSAVAGVYVDRIDRRLILIATNLLRGLAFVALYLAGDEPRGHPAAQHRDLDDHRVLRAGRAGDDPGARAALAAPRRERDLHADPQRGLRAGVRPARAAGRQGRRAGGGHPRRRRAVLPRRDLLRHAPGVATAAIDRGGAALRPGRGRGERRDGLDARPAPRGLHLHPRPSGRSPGRSSISAIAASLVGVLGVLGPGLRAGDARAQGRGLRGRRPAARVRDRDRDPAAQLVRSLLPPPAGHRGRPHRPRHPAGGPRPRPARSAASSSARTSRAGSTCRR